MKVEKYDGGWMVNQGPFPCSHGFSSHILFRNPPTPSKKFERHKPIKRTNSNPIGRRYLGDNQIHKSYLDQAGCRNSRLHHGPLLSWQSWRPGTHMPQRGCLRVHIQVSGVNNLSDNAVNKSAQMTMETQAFHFWHPKYPILQDGWQVYENLIPDEARSSMPRQNRTTNRCIGIYRERLNHGWGSEQSCVKLCLFQMIF